MRDRIVLHKCGSTAQEDMQRVRDVIGEWRKAASVQWSPGGTRRVTEYTWRAVS
jgi:hypothetical protein